MTASSLASALSEEVLDNFGRAGLDAIHAGWRGPLSLETTREDLADDGSARLRRKTVNQAV